MRTETQITNIVVGAKISYSQQVQDFERMRMRGVTENLWPLFFLASNCVFGIESVFLTLNEKSKLCDVLIRNGFTYNDNSLIFTEELFDPEDYDTV